MASLSFLDRERSIAHPGFSRWLVPPAALAIHLCIGQVYAFSVFKIPLTRLLGITKSLPDGWTQPRLAWIFSLAIVMLGLSAATFGKWLEGAGPRKAMFASASCFALGFFISYFGVLWHQLWLIYLGYGVGGGMGLGLGYISPVSTLIKWFPDRPGLATGTDPQSYVTTCAYDSRGPVYLFDAPSRPTESGSVGRAVGSPATIWLIPGVLKSSSRASHSP
jgi:MFS family permease